MFFIFGFQKPMLRLLLGVNYFIRCHTKVWLLWPVFDSSFAHSWLCSMNVFVSHWGFSLLCYLLSILGYKVTSGLFFRGPHGRCLLGSYFWLGGGLLFCFGYDDRAFSHLATNV